MEEQLELSNYLKKVKVLGTTIRQVTDFETRTLLAQQMDSKFFIYDEPHNNNKVGDGVVSSIKSVEGNMDIEPSIDGGNKFDFDWVTMSLEKKGPLSNKNRDLIYGILLEGTENERFQRQ